MHHLVGPFRVLHAQLLKDVMTTHPTIPRGWRRLRTGTTVRKGDRAWGFSHQTELRDVWKFQEICSTYWPVDSDETIIRRIAKKGKRK